MINILRKLGVEPVCIEQPLDLSIPENKMMLAIYLAAPEVENDRRALNTFHGMRRAKKEGRYMGHAPAGFINRVKEDGDKYIAFDEPEASIMKWSFEQLSKGIFNTEQIFYQAKKKGLKVSRNNFWRLMRNPVYCVKIVIPQYKDEKTRLVRGLHEPLISEAVFYMVQDILDRRGRNFRPKAVTAEPFPLRGFLICPDCCKLLTASISKGRNKYYSYYHCSARCKFRINADTVNKIFADHLKEYIPIPEIKPFYAAVIAERYRKETKEMLDSEEKATIQIKDYESRLIRARDLLSTGEIDPSDYREMKSDYSEMIFKLQSKLTNIHIDKDNVEEMLQNSTENLMKLSECYDSGAWAESRDLIGSIFPENFTIEKNGFRTARTNDVLRIIYVINKNIEQKKAGQRRNFPLYPAK